jgi:glycosyltransferase involved in cell wall biosynthesis
MVASAILGHCHPLSLDMRVLHIVSGKLYGGVETVLVTLARCREYCPEIEPEFALSYAGRLRDELTDAGVPVHNLGEVRVRYPLSIMRARARLRAVIADRQIDVIVCHMAWAHAIFATVARSENVPIVFWLHGAISGTHWLERWASLTQPNLALAPNAFAASTARNLFPALDCAVLHYPVVPYEPPAGNELREVVRRELAASPHSVVIVQASRMEPMKGHAYLLDALATLKDRTKWVCWQVGGPQQPGEVRYFEELRTKARALGIGERVHFLGQRADVPRILFGADVFCQPNPTPEGLPVVFIEALRAGLPVVGTQVGGFSEAIDDTCGRLVTPREPGALAAALRELIDDEALRRRLGNAGPARAAALSDPAAQMRKLSSLIGTLAGSNVGLPVGGRAHEEPRRIGS